MKKALIIGGSGHVSGAMTREALRAGFEVSIVTRGQRPVPDGVRTLTISNRNDPAAMQQLFNAVRDDFDVLIDCICYEPEAMRTVLELFRNRIGRLLFISTDFVYNPWLRRFPQPVDSPCLSDDVNGTQSYGYKKRVCELLLEQEPTLSWTVFRPCHIYGMPSLLGCLPMHARDKELLRRILDGETLTLVDGGRSLQQPIEVNDLAATVISAAFAPGAHRRYFNTAGPDIVESRQYYEIIAAALGVKLKYTALSREAYLEGKDGIFPMVCHRIYRLDDFVAAGIRPPSTPLVEGLSRHVRERLAADLSEQHATRPV